MKMHTHTRAHENILKVKVKEKERERERERERENSNRTPRSTSFFETLYVLPLDPNRGSARSTKEKKIKNPKFRKKPKKKKKTPPETL